MEEKIKTYSNCSAMRETAIERASNAWENYTKKSRYYVTFTDHLKLAPWQLCIRRLWTQKMEKRKQRRSWELSSAARANSWLTRCKSVKLKAMTKPECTHGQSHGWETRPWLAVAILHIRKSPSRNPSKVRISSDTKKTNSAKRTLLGLYTFTCGQFWFVCQQNVKSPSRCAAYIRQFSRIFELKLAV